MTKEISWDGKVTATIDFADYLNALELVAKIDTAMNVIKSGGGTITDKAFAVYTDLLSSSVDCINETIIEKFNDFLLEAGFID